MFSNFWVFSMKAISFAFSFYSRRPLSNFNSRTRYLCVPITDSFKSCVTPGGVFESMWEVGLGLPDPTPLGYAMGQIFARPKAEGDFGWAREFSRVFCQFWLDFVWVGGWLTPRGRGGGGRGWVVYEKRGWVW